MENERIQVFRLDGTLLRSWGHLGSQPGLFSSPFAVTVHGDLVVVSDQGNHRVQVFRLDGTFVRQFGSPGAAPGQLDLPRGTAISAAGEIFVCDYLNHRVTVFDFESGAHLRSWGQLGAQPGEFDSPSRNAIVGEQEILVGDFNNDRVQVFRLDGTFVRCLNVPAGRHGPFQPSGIAVTPTGGVVLCDYRNHRIWVDPAGTVGA